VARNKDISASIDEMAAEANQPSILSPSATGDEEQLGIDMEVPDVDLALEEKQPKSILDPTEDIVPVDDFEPIQVAGIGDVVEKIGAAATKRIRTAEERLLPKLGEEPIQQVGGVTVVRQASDEEITAINTALGGEYTKGINFPAIAEGVGEDDLANYLARLKDANSDLFEQARRGTLNFESLMSMAEQQGMDNIVGEWLAREPGSGEVAEKVLAGLLAARQTSEATRQAFLSARTITDPVSREATLAKAKQLMTVEAVLYANISGAGSEAGRLLYALREAQKGMDFGDPSVRAEQLVNLFGLEGEKQFEHIGELYLALPKPSRSKFVQQSLLAKGADAIIEVWINSILTSPVTHMVNIAGNSMFAAMRPLETAVAGAIGSARQAVGIGGADRVRAREAIAQVEGMRQSIIDSLIVAGKTFVTEEPSDLVSKIDVRNRRAIGTSGDPRVIAEEIKNGNFGAAFVNTMGIYARMGGRFLMAEDEFFKGIGYRSAIHQEAFVRSANLYDEMVAAGKTIDEAKLAAAAEKARILSNPPMDVVKGAKDAARELTFQGDIDGIFGSLQGAATHPIVKLFIPFYRTPYNVMAEALKRSPAVLANPKFYKKIKAGGREADLAIAQVATGSSIMGAFSYMAMGLNTPDSDVFIVGSGPSDVQARQAMARKNIQPFSVNVKQANGLYKSIPFSRLDPLSGMLAMSADFAYYAQYEEDKNTLEALAMAAAIGISEYAMEMPFLQGASQLSGVMNQSNPEERVNALMELFGEKATGAALSILPTVSSFSAGIERLQDPTSRSGMLPERGMFGEDPTRLPAFARGFYTALQKAKARNPFFSDEVEPVLNLWGREVTTGKGYGWEFWSPIRVNDVKYSIVDDEIMKLGDGPSMNSKKISGVRLNAKQYNRWLILQNRMDSFGRMPEDDGYDVSSTMLPVVAGLIRSDEYKQIKLKEDKLKVLNNVVYSYRSVARKKLLSEDPYLDSLVAAEQ
jgi:hypothetical protein